MVEWLPTETSGIHPPYRKTYVRRLLVEEDSDLHRLLLAAANPDYITLEDPLVDSDLTHRVWRFEVPTGHDLDVGEVADPDLPEVP